MVIPGGGPFADAVREADLRHRLPPSTAHWMAILAMDQYAELLAAVVPGSEIVRDSAGVVAARQARCGSDPGSVDLAQGGRRAAPLLGGDQRQPRGLSRGIAGCRTAAAGEGGGRERWTSWWIPGSGGRSPPGWRVARSLRRMWRPPEIGSGANRQGRRTGVQGGTQGGHPRLGHPVVPTSIAGGAPDADDIGASHEDGSRRSLPRRLPARATRRPALEAAAAKAATAPRDTSSVSRSPPLIAVSSSNAGDALRHRRSHHDGRRRRARPTPSRRRRPRPAGRAARKAPIASRVRASASRTSDSSWRPANPSLGEQHLTGPERRQLLGDSRRRRAHRPARP